MDESQDTKPHPHLVDEHAAAPASRGLSIWFFCGILMLAYGIVLVVTGAMEFHNPPPTVLSSLHPTLWWGVVLTLFGLFYTVGFRPGRG